LEGGREKQDLREIKKKRFKYGLEEIKQGEKKVSRVSGGGEPKKKEKRLQKKEHEINHDSTYKEGKGGKKDDSKKKGRQKR